MLSEFRKKAALKVFRSYRTNAVKLHELNSLFWECTLRCNLHCLHCGSDCSHNSLAADMPLADFLVALDSISKHVKPKNLFVIFSGGEPLMRDDLEECGKAVGDRGFDWGMVTNGLALSKARLDSLMQSEIKSISISLDGLKDSHNALRCHPDSFDKAIEAIINVAAIPNFTFDVITCVSELNIHELRQIKDLLISLNVKHWRINTIFPVGRGAQNKKLMLGDKDFTALMEFIAITRRENKIHLQYSCEGFLGDYESKVRDSFYFCRAGINIGSILVDGSISACPNMRSNFIQGNIYKDDFMTVWNNKFEKHRNREWTKKDQCKNCKDFKNCEGNGLHLYDENEELQVCHLRRIVQ
jgi:radical SAM enzyme (rSAM/lipoprotein system)